MGQLKLNTNTIDTVSYELHPTRLYYVVILLAVTGLLQVIDKAGTGLKSMHIFDRGMQQIVVCLAGGRTTDGGWRIEV